MTDSENKLENDDTIAGARATAQEKLDKMVARLKELDYMATSYAVAGQTLPGEAEEEYRKLKSEIDEELRALKRGS